MGKTNKRKPSLKARLAKVGKFFKIWGGLFVAIVALGVSISTCYTERVNLNESSQREDKRDKALRAYNDEIRAYNEATRVYNEATRKIAQDALELAQTVSEYQQIKDRLGMLNTKFQRAKEWIYTWRMFGKDTTHFEDYLKEAESLSDKANKAWNDENYGEADDLISKAYDYLDKIPAPPIPPATPPMLPPGVTATFDIVDENGIFTKALIAKSGDTKVNLTIKSGTTGKTKEGKPIRWIIITELAQPPALLPSAKIIGSTYDLGPDGATFDPAITLAISYDPDRIPKWANQEDLVIAMWDKDTGNWTILEGLAVDPLTNTITVPVKHFTPFGILAPFSLMPAPPTLPTLPSPKPPPAFPPAPGANWVLLMGIIIAGVIVIGLIAWVVVRRRVEGYK